MKQPPQYAQRFRDLVAADLATVLGGICQVTLRPAPTTKALPAAQVRSLMPPKAQNVGTWDVPVYPGRVSWYVQIVVPPWGDARGAHPAWLLLWPAPRMPRRLMAWVIANQIGPEVIKGLAFQRRRWYRRAASA